METKLRALIKECIQEVIVELNTPKRSDEEKRRAAARREAEIKSGYKKPKGGAIPSGKEKAREKDKKKGRKPVKP